ncbi:hypothetical protein JB92DRAFT_2849290 [Gautieria morchelliformis]|nr:hypothetical protein JB92DRAFT_2849290 [Gautieria morchelliformis]
MSQPLLMLLKLLPTALGLAIATSKMGLVYGGGKKGIMGTVSGAALEAGAKVIGIVPYAMVKNTKEVRNINDGNTGTDEEKFVLLNEDGQVSGWENMETVVVQSMHERKVEMAKRVCGFFGLPGGFGTFEELLEVTTWSQIGLHGKPVVILNVLGFYEPLRDLIRSGIRTGFIPAKNEGLMIFVDGPSDLTAHETFDWGTPALVALRNWNNPGFDFGFDWTKKLGNKQLEGTCTALDAS